MSEVKRWEPRNTSLGYDMQPIPSGSFVLISDYEALAAQRDEGLAREAKLHSACSKEFADVEMLSNKVEALNKHLAEADKNARRYEKLRRWMSSNVAEGWSEVEKLASVACYVGWGDFDSYLDALPECNVGLCQVAEQKCTGCEPSAEELKLIAIGDYCAEELWGGPRPTCPECIDK